MTELGIDIVDEGERTYITLDVERDCSIVKVELFSTRLTLGPVSQEQRAAFEALQRALALVPAPQDAA